MTLDLVRALSGDFEGIVLEDEPMSRHTTYRIGGPARYLVRADSLSALVRATDACREAGMPWVAVGQGSNLLVSDDGKNWRVAFDIIDKRAEDCTKVGFQYISMAVEGDDLVFLCRTAMNGADSYHNSNYITFHRIKDFRRLID